MSRCTLALLPSLASCRGFLAQEASLVSKKLPQLAPLCREMWRGSPPRPASLHGLVHTHRLGRHLPEAPREAGNSWILFLGRLCGILNAPRIPLCCGTCCSATEPGCLLALPGMSSPIHQLLLARSRGLTLLPFPTSACLSRCLAVSLWDSGVSTSNMHTRHLPEARFCLCVNPQSLSRLKHRLSPSLGVISQML